MSDNIDAVTVDSACQLRYGDVMVLYTDGVTEAMDPTGDLFGEERLQAVILERRGETAPVLLRAIWDAVKAHRQGSLDDDMTIVVMKGMA